MHNSLRRTSILLGKGTTLKDLGFVRMCVCPWSLFLTVRETSGASKKYTVSSHAHNQVVNQVSVIVTALRLSSCLYLRPYKCPS